jgi:hypothetical protein
MQRYRAVDVDLKLHPQDHDDLIKTMEQFDVGLALERKKRVLRLRCQIRWEVRLWVWRSRQQHFLVRESFAASSDRALSVRLTKITGRRFGPMD